RGEFFRERRDHFYRRPPPQGPPEALRSSQAFNREEQRPLPGGGGRGRGVPVGGVAVVAVAAKGGPESRANQRQQHQGLRAQPFARRVEAEGRHLEGAPDRERDRAEDL